MGRPHGCVCALSDRVPFENSGLPCEPRSVGRRSFLRALWFPYHRHPARRERPISFSAKFLRATGPAHLADLLPVGRGRLHCQSEIGSCVCLSPQLLQVGVLPAVHAEHPVLGFWAHPAADHVVAGSGRTVLSDMAAGSADLQPYEPASRADAADRQRAAGPAGSVPQPRR